MARWSRLGLMALMLLAVWGCATGQTMTATNPVQPRFTKAANGVISDHLTGLDWYVRPTADNNWYEAKAWVDGLTVAGGGWRMPTVPELKGIYQKGPPGPIWTRYSNRSRPGSGPGRWTTPGRIMALPSTAVW